MTAALFDLDGVLIDTEGTYSTFWGQMGLRYNVGIDNFADIIKGTTLTQILNKYFSPELHPQINAELDVFEQNMQYRIFPGVLDFLHQLSLESIPAAIVTSSSQKKLDNLFSQHPSLKEYFQAIITDSQVTKSKPDPQGYLLAAERVHCHPEHCYVFEDSFNGLIAGRRSGARVIALATTNPENTLTELADLVIPGFENFSVQQMLSV